ncbi:MAG: hypothetical protein M0D57_18895 [Sphingobacteriales bacterium JAD_PAG50586_3]|nr:MAG: hypothetical protein M0D57_18895 [Sphingobacteriales bacterium JAD_PAG50586_3]
MEAHKIPFKLIFTYVLKVLGLVVGIPLLLSPMVNSAGMHSTTLMAVSGGLISFLFIYFAYMLITGIYRFNCDVTEIKALVSVLFLLVIFLSAHILLVFCFDGHGFQPAVLSFVLPQALVGLAAIWAFRLPENI